MSSEKGLTPKKETQNKTNNELNNEKSSDTAIALESDDKTRFSIRIWSLILVALVIFCTVITPLPVSAATNSKLCNAIKTIYLLDNGSDGGSYYGDGEGITPEEVQSGSRIISDESYKETAYTKDDGFNTVTLYWSTKQFRKDLKTILSGKSLSINGETILTDANWESGSLTTDMLSEEAKSYIFAMYASADADADALTGENYNLHDNESGKIGVAIDFNNVLLSELEPYFKDYETLQSEFFVWCGYEADADPADVMNDQNAMTHEDPEEPTYYALIMDEGDFRFATGTTPTKILQEYEKYGYILDSGGTLGTFISHPGATLKAWLVGGVASSYAGALDSIWDSVDKTQELLTRNLDASGPNYTIYNTVKTICNNVIVPIGGVMLAFIFAYEIYELVCERNNMNDIGAGSFIQLFIKMFIAIIVVINAWNLTEWVFSIGNWIVNQALPTINSMDANQNLMDVVNGWDVGTDSDTKLKGIFAYYISVNDDINFGSIIVLLLQGFIINIGMLVVSLLVYVIVWVRMIEIYLYCAVAPIPLATLTNRSWGQVGMGFIRQVAGLAFQAFIIILCLGIFQVLLGSTFNVSNVMNSSALTSEMWAVIGYSIILVFCLFKSGSLAKSMMGAH